MSDAFEKLMSQSENRENEKVSSPGGRPMHEHWTGFDKIVQNGRPAAYCTICKGTVANTAKARLQSHR